MTPITHYRASSPFPGAFHALPEGVAWPSRNLDSQPLTLVPLRQCHVYCDPRCPPQRPETVGNAGGRSSCPHPAKVSPGDTGIHLSLVPIPFLLHVQVVRHIPPNTPAAPVAFPLRCSQLRSPCQRKPNPRWALTPCSVPCTSWPLVDRRGPQVQALALDGSQMLRHPVLPWTGPSPRRKQAPCSAHQCQPVKLSSSRSTPH